ncbi:MAG: FHA domain-containing protein [Kiritimatiellae bacterium]|nr:FHA domain-containing protein [Kiritimatiellia bacterium]
MPFSLQFVQGSLAGRRFPVGPAGVSVGRSHSCDARPKEADVSGKHVSVMPAGDALAVTVLSAHRTVADGVRQSQGSVFAAQAGTTVRLGDHLEFRVVDDSAADDGETGSIPGRFTATLGSETGTSPASLTAATRFGGDETGTSPASLTAATRFGGEETGTSPASLTAATRFDAGGAAPAEDGETAIYHPSASAGGETGTGEAAGGETQVLQTQAVSGEELEAMREMFRKKKSGKAVSRAVAIAIALGAAAGFTAWMSSKKPELVIVEKTPWETKALRAGASGVQGTFGIAWPTNSGPALVRVSEDGGRTDAETKIGRDGDVTLWVSAIVFDDPEALSESRNDTFSRHLEHSKEMAPAMDGMVPLPEEDFFGGAGGLHHGVPCSRREYWRDRPDGEPVWGVVSFFRFGSTCCSVRREVAAAERERAKALLEPSARFVWADRDGRFADSQWEGAAGAGCKDPGAELRRCSERLAVESPAEWPALETRLRNVLAETSKPGTEPALEDVRRAALDELVKLRVRKALVWRQQVAYRESLAASTGRDGEAAKKEADALVRKTFPDASEQWGALAMRRVWWK